MTARRLVTVLPAVVLVLALAGCVGVVWYFTDQEVRPSHPAPAFPERVLGVAPAPGGGATVSLAMSAAASRPGQYGLAWPGGSAMLGDVVHSSTDRVERVLISGAWPTAGSPAALAYTYSGDPRTALGLDFTEVTVRSELGPAPAWYMPGYGSTWAITVHGSNANRNQGLQVAAPLHQLGLPVLDITYRNDVGAPPSPDGVMHLGESEWRDLEAAVRTAMSMGARHVVLVGGSMGGAIVTQFLAHSSLADAVSATVLDNPMLSVPRHMDYVATVRHIPAPLTWAAARLIDWRTGSQVSQLDVLRDLPAHTPPTLLLHGDADQIMPVEVARELAATGPGRGWPIRYEEFPGAGHGEVWSSNPTRYQQVVTDYLSGVLSPN
jgi:pimeloyl-ACP methyl ester carboxylesterase